MMNELCAVPWGDVPGRRVGEQPISRLQGGLWAICTFSH